MAWLASVQISGNKLILVNKWFEGGGIVNLVEFPKTCIKALKRRHFYIKQGSIYLSNVILITHAFNVPNWLYSFRLSNAYQVKYEDQVMAWQQTITKTVMTQITDVYMRHPALMRF